MTGMHINREFFQLKPVYAPYQVLPLHNLYLREEYRGVRLGDKLIGFTLTVLERLEDPPWLVEKKKADAARGEKSPLVDHSDYGPDISDKAAGALYELRHHTYMTFLFLGHEREMLIRSKALLNSRLEMQAFAMKVTSGEYWTEMEGQITAGNMNLVIKEKEAEPVRKIIPVPSPLYFSEALSVIWTPENLSTGRRGRLHVWNPLQLGVEEIEFKVGNKEEVEQDGKNVEAYLVFITEQGMETRYWVTLEGILIKHESSTGLVLEKMEAWKIFDTLRETRGDLQDLPNLYSTPSNLLIENPGGLTMLKAEVKLLEELSLIENHRVETEAFKAVPLLPPAGTDLTEYLAADEFLQSDHPEIKSRAKEIANSETTAWGAAVRLLDWVHAYVQPTPTISLPSALQVLKIKKGDCNEYTALYTALARAMGIPARMVAGLVYQNGRFFYHAWTEIYISSWVPVDPTFNQAPADVTHLALVRGNLKEQVDLVRRLGKTTVKVIETA